MVGRLLLLEFVTRERWVFDSRLFPFIQGGARELGFRTRWLCYGAAVCTEKQGETGVVQYMDLGPAERAGLAAAVEELAPTHVVISHPVSPAVLAVLTRGRADVHILCTSDHPAPPGAVNLRTYTAGDPAETEGPARDLADLARLGGDRGSWRMARTDWLLRWLGRQPGDGAPFGRYLVGTVTPDYAAVLANEEARECRPHLLLLGGVVCDHFAAVGANPHYAALDLSDCVHRHGCAYCTWYRGPTSDLHGDPLRAAEQQLRRVLETAGDDGRFCGIVDVLDIRLFRRIDRFADLVLRLGLPPTTFCFEPRVDRVLQVGPRLERALAELAPAGHAVSLFRLGAETLVEEENAFYNKHLTLAQLDLGTRRLAELAARFPGVFAYDPTWGYITCSPWTTLEMLETGIERAVERGFEPLGVWLYTPVLLYRGSALTTLAEAQGDVLVPEFEDASLLYEAAVNGVPLARLTAWRFKDERTGVVFALIVRFCAAALRDKYPDTIFRGDPLYERLLASEPTAGPFDRPDLFAQEAVALVKAAPPPYDRAALLTAALARTRATAARTAAREAAGRAAGSGEPDPGAERADHAERGGRAERGDRAERPAGPGPTEDGSAAPRTGEGDAGPRNPAPGPVLDERAKRVWQLLEAVRRHLDPAAERLRVVRVRRDPAQDLFALRLEIEGAGYDLTLACAGAGQPAFVRSSHFGVTYDPATPLSSAAHVGTVQRLLRLFDAAAVRHAPDLLAPDRPAPPA